MFNITEDQIFKILFDLMPPAVTVKPFPAILPGNPGYEAYQKELQIYQGAYFFCKCWAFLFEDFFTNTLQELYKEMNIQTATDDFIVNYASFTKTNYPEEIIGTPSFRKTVIADWAMEGFPLTYSNFKRYLDLSSHTLNSYNLSATEYLTIEINTTPQGTDYGLLDFSNKLGLNRRIYVTSTHNTDAFYSSYTDNDLSHFTDLELEYGF